MRRWQRHPLEPMPPGEWLRVARLLSLTLLILLAGWGLLIAAGWLLVAAVRWLW